MSAAALPEYRLKARNTSTQSENTIHHDDVAKRYGFGGGLVPGVTVYAYLTHPLVEALGPAWLERGTASVRFTRPLLDGDETVMCRHGGSRGAGDRRHRHRPERTGDCSVATAGLPDAPAAAPDAAAYRAAPLPAERPPALAANLPRARSWGRR